ncbi:uncharacterized protein LOC128839228 isoform X2 [Malaclemys terrapin pileata]|uniref:uncharacterized protein LOC128839228 isoform X2 n=1 Tax=Malaclemys terrapin pileata TaxID=2991368 RepID=UPI0023A79F64|nr:uncharacterized protein LOC128839228 isoform X2 [Malaclemys terrapin pileata]
MVQSLSRQEKCQQLKCSCFFTNKEETKTTEKKIECSPGNELTQDLTKKIHIGDIGFLCFKQKGLEKAIQQVMCP